MFGIVLTVLGIVGLIVAAVNFATSKAGDMNVRMILIFSILGGIFFFTGIGLIKTTKDRSAWFKTLARSVYLLFSLKLIGCLARPCNSICINFGVSACWKFVAHFLLNCVQSASCLQLLQSTFVLRFSCADNKMYKWSSRQGHFSPSLSQNRAWDSHLTRLFSFSGKRFNHMIELNLIFLGLLLVVFLSANEWAKPFAPFPLQKLLHYYDLVRHSTTLRLPLEYLELQLSFG